MDTVSAVGLLMVATILFYRFVERRHKIILAKIVGVVILLGASVVGYLVIQDRKQSARAARIRNSVSITHVAAIPAYEDIVGERSDTVRNVSFRLCNHGSDTVTSVIFTPKTSLRGRSTAYDLVLSRASVYSYAHTLESDYIFAPGACSTISWSAGSGAGFFARDTVLRKQSR